VTVADTFHRQYGSPHLYATCRAQYGAILFAVGRWADAERELDHAIRISEDAEANVRAEAMAALAEVRLAQGRPDEAARLLAGHEAHPAAVVALARLHLSQGRPRAATSLLRRRLRHQETGAISATTLQDLLVEAEVLSGDVGAATRTASALSAVARTMGAKVVAARAERAAGRVALGHGDRAAAAAHHVSAVEAFEGAELPLDAARTRLLLAQALAESDSESAAADARQSLATFDRVGAVRDADAAVALLRSLGVRATRSAPTAAGVLTRRELEVLVLVAEGLSNREIGDRLFITPKTAEHHVANVLAKTGLSRRTEAAAYAYRNLSGWLPRK
jgi:DNA-binding CsgD family transcriptional regulator